MPPQVDKSIHRNTNSYSVEIPAEKTYDKDSEVPGPITPTPESRQSLKQKEVSNNISIKNDDEQLRNPAMEVQTDLDNGLKMKLRRSRKSFQNQVYLADSQATLKSKFQSS